MWIPEKTRGGTQRCLIADVSQPLAGLCLSKTRLDASSSFQLFPCMVSSPPTTPLALVLALWCLRFYIFNAKPHFSPFWVPEFLLTKQQWLFFHSSKFILHVLNFSIFSSPQLIFWHKEDFFISGMPVPSLDGACGETALGKLWKLFLHIRVFRNKLLVETFAKGNRSRFHVWFSWAFMFGCIFL